MTNDNVKPISEPWHPEPKQSEPAILPQLTADEKLNIRNIQYNFYLLRLKQEEIQQSMVTLSQHLQQTETQLVQSHGLDVSKVMFDRDNLRFIERPKQ
jgi:hypothetical protein